jgi:hypothetical protein
MKDVVGSADAFLSVTRGVKPTIIIVGDPLE